MTIKKFIFQSGVVGAAVIGIVACGVAPSYAAVTPVPAASVGSASGASSQDAAAAAAQAKLKSLVGTQTTAEIAAIVNWDGPAQILYDANLKPIAAYKETPAKFSTKAVVQLSPGCSTTSACLHSSTPHGYEGRGSLAVNVPGSTSLFAGNDGSDTGIYNGDAGLIVKSQHTATFPSFTVKKIVRSVAA